MPRSPSPLLTSIAGDAELLIRSEPAREVDLRVMTWDAVAETAQGRERFRRGAFADTDPSTVALEAIGPHGADPGVRLAGVGRSLEERDDGAFMTFRVSRTAAGDELLELARDGVYRGASVVFAEVPGGSRRARDGVIEPERVDLRRVGIVERGSYPAGVLAVRSEEANRMPAPQTPVPDPQPTPVPDPTPAPVPDPEPLRGRAAPQVQVLTGDDLEELRTDLVGRMIALEGRSAGGGGASPLAEFGSLVAYVDAAYARPELTPLLGRALVDQLTTDNPGVIPPAWVQNIAGISAFARPAVTALGGPRSLGASGMDLEWPYLDPATPLDTIVAKQAAEKTEIASVKVKILKATQPIDTYAGGSDVSYQLIRRSSPSYREAYLRILDIAYNRATEAAFEAQLVAVAGTSMVLSATANADAVRAFLFAASSAVEDATGSPATVDLVSPAEFARLGGLPGLFPSQYGTQNVPGTAQASTLAINISGLPIVRAPFLTGNTHLVTNSEAAGWHEDGPFPISAEDVAKLGQNVAIWGMGTGATTAPKGIVKTTVVAGRGASAE